MAKYGIPVQNARVAVNENLPIATKRTLGAIRVGDDLNIKEDGVLGINKLTDSEILNLNSTPNLDFKFLNGRGLKTFIANFTGGSGGGGGSSNPYVLPQAKESTLGGIKAPAITPGLDTIPVKIDDSTGFLYTQANATMIFSDSEYVNGTPVKGIAILDKHTNQYDYYNLSGGGSGGGGSFTLPQATETVLGGIKAKAKTTEDVEVAIDAASGKLFVKRSKPLVTDFESGNNVSITDANGKVNISLSNVATLENGKIPESQLPSYVDDVLEFSSKTSFPSTGESGKIYVALDTNKTYRWGGSAYVEISSSLGLASESTLGGIKAPAITPGLDTIPVKIDDSTGFLYTQANATMIFSDSVHPGATVVKSIAILDKHTNQYDYYNLSGETPMSVSQFNMKENSDVEYATSQEIITLFSIKNN